ASGRAVAQGIRPSEASQEGRSRTQKTLQISRLPPRRARLMALKLHPCQLRHVSADRRDRAEAERIAPSAAVIRARTGKLQPRRNRAQVDERPMRNETLGILKRWRYRLAAVSPGTRAARGVWPFFGTVLVIALLAGCGTRQSATGAAMAPALLPPQPATPGPDYRVQVGDELHIHFLYQPDNNDQLVVRPDGRISLAAAGEIDAVGLTPTELEKIIVEKSSAHLRNPDVTVVVTKVGDQHVYVGGEVL